MNTKFSNAPPGLLAKRPFLTLTGNREGFTYGKIPAYEINFDRWGASGVGVCKFAVQENITGRLVPDSSVVVPDDGTAGSVEIWLESSNDLTSWEVEYVGQHGGDLSTKRFWRARVVRQ